MLTRSSCGFPEAMNIHGKLFFPKNWHTTESNYIDSAHLMTCYHENDNLLCNRKLKLRKPKHVFLIKNIVKFTAFHHTLSLKGNKKLKTVSRKRRSKPVSNYKTPEPTKWNCNFMHKGKKRNHLISICKFKKANIKT